MEDIRTVPYSLKIAADPGHVSVEIYEPINPFAVLTLGHGAGTTMSHEGVKSLAFQLSKRGIVTVRFNFPYSEKGKKIPDRMPVATATIKTLFEDLEVRYPNLPLYGGGRSFGGRMTSQMQATYSLNSLRGIIFYGFPLHPAGAPAIDRADHLVQVSVPLLFLSGTQDALAQTDLIKGVCSKLPNAELILLEGADHSFQKAKARNLELLCSHSVDWLHRTMNG